LQFSQGCSKSWGVKIASPHNTDNATFCFSSLEIEAGIYCNYRGIIITPPVKPAEQQLPVTLPSDSANDLYKDKRIMAKRYRPSARGIAVIDNAFCGKAF